MAAPPKVQTISEAMMELNPAFAQSTAVIQQKQAGLGAKYDAQRAGLTAKKGEGFNTINNQATGRGMSFSGIPADEQARYLSTEYLPGMQMADYQQNNEDLELQGQIAGINKEQSLSAIGRVDRQTSELNQWNMAEVEREARAREAQIAREFEAGENAKSRAASAASSAPKAMSPYNSALSVINSAVGSGAKIDSNVFQLARDAYRMAGGDTHKFAGEFWKYVPAEANKNNAARGGGGWRDYYHG